MVRVCNSEMVLLLFLFYAMMFLLGMCRATTEVVMADKMISKEFTDKQRDVVCSALEMLSKSLERRIVAETDSDAKAVWQRKKDEVAVLLSKVRG